jgi:hypothetical protein
MAQESVHPRPQLVREEWTDLCGEWGFAHDDDDTGLASGWQLRTEPFDRTIVVPFPPESKSSGIHDTAYHPVVWYRREIAVAEPSGDERLLLHFGAVDYSARVWVDGVHVGAHEGGHTPFSCDLTDALAPDREEHVVVVRAEDPPTDVAQPRGKQDWRPEPHGIWYHRTTGIWQPVWLERVPATHIVEVQWTPDIAAGRVRLEVGLNRTPDTAMTLRTRLHLHGDLLAENTVRLTSHRTVTDIATPSCASSTRPGRWTSSPATWACARWAPRTAGSSSTVCPTTSVACSRRATGPSPIWRRPTPIRCAARSS